MAFYQGLRLMQGAIGHGDTGRADGNQRIEDTCGCPTRTQKQQMQAAKGEAGIEHNITHDAGTVGIVGMQHQAPAFFGALPHQGVGRLGQHGARRVAGRCGESRVLERHGDVAAAVAGFLQALQGGGKPVWRAIDGFICDSLTGLLGKAGVYPRGAAVGHRMTDDGVAGNRNVSHERTEGKKSCRSRGCRGCGQGGHVRQGLIAWTA